MSGDDPIRVDCLRAELRAAGAPYLVFYDVDGPFGTNQPFLFERWEADPEPHVTARFYYMTFDALRTIVHNHMEDWRAAGSKQVLTEDGRFIEFVFRNAYNSTS